MLLLSFLPFSPLPHSHSIFLSIFLSLPLHFHSIFLLSLLLLLLRTNGCCPYFEQIRFLTEVPCSVIVLICISLFSKRKRRRKKEKKYSGKKLACRYSFTVLWRENPRNKNVSSHALACTHIHAVYVAVCVRQKEWEILSHTACGPVVCFAEINLSKSTVSPCMKAFLISFCFPSHIRKTWSSTGSS